MIISIVAEKSFDKIESPTVIKGKVEVKVAQSCPALCDPNPWTPWNSPSQNTGVGSLSLLQGTFPT